MAPIRRPRSASKERGEHRYGSREPPGQGQRRERASFGAVRASPRACARFPIDGGVDRFLWSIRWIAAGPCLLLICKSISDVHFCLRHPAESTTPRQGRQGRFARHLTGLGPHGTPFRVMADDRGFRRPPCRLRPWPCLPAPWPSPSRAPSGPRRTSSRSRSDASVSRSCRSSRCCSSS